MKIRFLQFFLALLAFCHVPPLRAQTITTRVVDYGSGGFTGRYSSLAIVNGNPAISYYNLTDGMLMFARNSAADGSGTWAILSLDSEGAVGLYTSLSVVNGNPAISYLDFANGTLKYVRANDVNGTTWGAPVTVAAIGDGGSSSLKIVNGKPAIAYYDGTGNDLKYVRALDANGTNWGVPVTVDSTGDVGSFASLVNVNGNPAISYRDVTTNVSILKYVRAGDIDGTSWGLPVTVDSTITSGTYSSMAIVNGNPAISYFDSAGVRQDLKYVRANDADGTGWGTPVTAVSSGQVGQYTSLVIVNGNPAISFYDVGNLDLKFVRASDVNGAAWAAAVTVDSTGSVGTYTSLKVVNGNPAISYYDATNGNLKFARASNVNGTSWASAIADAGTQCGAVGTFSSQAIVNGHPAIAYYDDGNNDLKYVRATAPDGTGWGTPVTVDSTSVTDVGWNPSMAIVNGTPAIAYYDNTNSDLRYVRANDADGTSWGTPMIVAGTGSTGADPSLAFVNGCPAISYHDFTGSVYKYVRATDANGTGWGTPVTLASSGSVGSGATLVVVNGNPAVSYCDGTTYDLKYMRANDANGTGWGVPVTLDSIGFVGLNPSLAVLNGRPAISYGDATNGDLKYVRAGDANGTSWGTPVTVDSVNDVGSISSLGIVRGKPAIGYRDFTSNDVKYVRANDANGTSWGTPMVVDSAGDLSLGSMIILNGNPVFSYYEDLTWNLKWASLVYPPTPEIAVEQPAGNTLGDGTGSVQFGPVVVGGSSAAFTFTITNPGTADLTGLARSKDGPDANDFTVSVLSGTGIPVGAGTVTFTVTFTVSFTPSGGGPRTAALHIASNVSGSDNPFDIALSGTGLAPLQNWRQIFYGTTSNTGNAADAADPYHTGVPNLAVFAVLGLNQDPAKVAAGLLPQPQIMGGNYVITLTQPTGVSGVTYGAEWKADLSSVSWLPAEHTISGNTHTFSVPIADNLQIFMRLRVSSP